MKLYYAMARGIKYEHMVVSETKEKARESLKKWWYESQDRHHTSELSFEEAEEYFGFWFDSIETDKAFVM
mgnify:FL=1